MTMMKRQYTLSHIVTENHITATHCVTDRKITFIDRHDKKEEKNIYFQLFFVSLQCFKAVLHCFKQWATHKRTENK